MQAEWPRSIRVPRWLRAKRNTEAQTRAWKCDLGARSPGADLTTNRSMGMHSMLMSQGETTFLASTVQPAKRTPSWSFEDSSQGRPYHRSVWPQSRPLETARVEYDRPIAVET